MSELPHAKSPCAECPWRRDQKPGRDTPERFAQLAVTAYDMARTIFACHKGKEDSPMACAGWLLQQGAHNLSVRLGRIDWRQLRESPHALYDNYRQMAIANGVKPSDPALRHCRDDGQMATKRRAP